MLERRLQSLRCVAPSRCVKDSSSSSGARASACGTNAENRVAPAARRTGVPPVSNATATRVRDRGGPRRQPDGGTRPRDRRVVSRAAAANGSSRTGYAIEVVNAGVSGDTSAGGLVAARLVARRRRRGAGGGARRQRRPARAAGRRAEEEPRDDHRARAKQRASRCCLTGMEAPPNYGRDYTVVPSGRSATRGEGDWSRSCRFFFRASPASRA